MLDENYVEYIYRVISISEPITEKKRKHLIDYSKMKLGFIYILLILNVNNI